MSRFTLAALVGLALLLGGCAKEIPDPGAEEVDPTNPKSVLGSVFWAARTGKADHLASLCSPDGSGNASVKRICRVTPDSPDWTSFRENFSRGHINGEPRITGDTAVLKFLYGPSGSTKETMTMTRRDGRWFLERF